MSARALLFLQLFVLLLLSSLIVFGLSYASYWEVWWFSGTAHFLGGLWVGLCGAWIFRLQGTHVGILGCMAIALGAGLSWELYEYFIGATLFPENSVDTIQDIIMDIGGGLAAGFLASKKT